MKTTRLSDHIFQFSELFDNLELIVDLIDNGSWVEWLSDNGIEIGKRRFIVHQDPKDAILHNVIDSAIKKSINEYFKLTKFDYKKYLYEYKSMYARKYNLSDIGMGPHVDFFYINGGSEKIVPAFTICCYLTDDYTGGHIEFPDQNISVKPKAGSVIIFPSGEIHAVSPILDGNRIIISTFIYNA